MNQNKTQMKQSEMNLVKCQPQQFRMPSLDKRSFAFDAGLNPLPIQRRRHANSRKLTKENLMPFDRSGSCVRSPDFRDCSVRKYAHDINTPNSIDNRSWYQ